MAAAAPTPIAAASAYVAYALTDAGASPDGVAA